MKREGKFITFEGGEGTGKSTQCKLLADFLGARGVEVVLTREPGGCVEAEHIRDLLVTGAASRWEGVTEALLQFASRRENLYHVVWPALEKGAWVLCDRYADSSFAYQGAGRGLDATVLQDLYRIVAGSFQPDLTYIFDLPPDIGLARAFSRTKGGQAEHRFESLGLEFHQRVYQEFLTIATREPQRCRIIDAAQDVGAVHQQIVDLLLKEFLHVSSA